MAGTSSTHGSFHGKTDRIVVQRVPSHGWDYLLQPRYGVFYDFLLLAPILAWICSPTSQRGHRYSRVTGFIVLLILPCVLALSWIRVGRGEIRWIQACNQDIARDTRQLLDDPRSIPQDCNPFVAICRFPEEVRVSLAQALVLGGYNLASPAFRQRHPQLLGDPQPPASSSEVDCGSSQ